MRKFDFGMFWHFLLWVSALVVIIMGLTIGHVYTGQKLLLERRLEQQGRSLLTNICAWARDPIKQQEFPTLLAFVRDLKASGVVEYAAILDNQGIIIAHSDQGKIGRRPEDAATVRVLASHRHGKPEGQDIYIDEKGRLVRYREFYAPVTYQGIFFDAFIRIGYNFEKHIEAPIRRTQRQMMLIFLCAVLGGIGLSMVLAGRFVKPVRLLAVGAERIGAGDYAHSIEVSSPRELQQLGDVFNSMRLRIQEHMAQIEEANRQLDRKVFELGILYDVAQKMNFRSFSPELLAYLLDATLEALDARWGSLMMLNDENGRLTIKMVRGAGLDKGTAVDLAVGSGIAGLVFQSGEGIIANDGYADHRFERHEGLEDFQKTIEQIICVPLLVENRPIGVLNIVNRSSGKPFNEDDMRLLTALAAQAARSLENARLYDEAIRESKTGLFIPRYFEARVHEEIVLSKRYKQRFSVLLADIDHFKLVNDRHGHLIGDEALVKLAKFILDTLRENIDVASRFGGEEFAMLLPKTDMDGALIYAERLRQVVEESSEDAEAGLPPLTISIGCATFPGHGQSVKSLMQKADDALYEAKRTGRNRVCGAKV